jgi:hypothetical protein
MKFTKLLILLTLLNIITLSLSAKTGAPVGIVAAISEAKVLEAQQKNFPTLIDQASKVQIPDQEFTIPGSWANTVIKINKIKFDLQKVVSDNISILFEGDSHINIYGKKIKASGSLDAYVKVGIMPEVSATITIAVSKLDLAFKTRLGMKPHSKFPLKHIATLTMDDLTVAIEFDFHFANSYMDSVKSYFDGTIKEQINTYIKSSLKDTLLPIINTQAAAYVETLPVYVPTSIEKVLMDYSLISAPKIVGKILIFNIDGRIVQKGDPNDKADYPVGSKALPAMTVAPKGVKMFVSPYTINTFLHSVYYRSLLKYGFQVPNVNNIIPKKEGLLSSLNPVNVFRDMLKTKFGGDKRGLFEFDFAKLPQITLKNRVLSGSYELRIAFSLEKDEHVKQEKSRKVAQGVAATPVVDVPVPNSNFELFAGFLVNVDISATVKVNEGGKVNASIEKVDITNVKILQNFFGKKMIDSIAKSLVDYGVNSSKDWINTGYLSDIKFTLPDIAGMNFMDSKATINDDYIEFDIGVRFTSQRKKRFFKK